MNTELVRAPKLRPFTANTCLILLGVTSAVTACGGGAPESISEAPQLLAQAAGPARALPDKAGAAKRIPKDVAGGRVVIKFHEGTGVRMRGSSTANGITVVQAAGNGTANLDHPGYNGLFDRSVRDSGSIMVGASRSSAREPMCWSNYGSRIDLHAWGENVTTTGGYPDLYDGPLGREDNYTQSFSGTSSATPIVAGAVALAQSIAIEASEDPFEPAEVLALLASTGKPQTGTLSRPIGALPDLAEAAPLAAGGEGSCGNGVCDASESCSSCASDCGV